MERCDAIRYHIDEQDARAGDFVPDPFDAEPRRDPTQYAAHYDAIQELSGRKKPLGHRAAKTDALYRATGVWVR
jgi:hypothetical protein